MPRIRNMLERPAAAANRPAGLERRAYRQQFAGAFVNIGHGDAGSRA
jgi:hypothetical protein